MSDFLIGFGTAVTVGLRVWWESGLHGCDECQFMDKAGFGMLLGVAIALSGYAIAFGMVN